MNEPAAPPPYLGELSKGDSKSPVADADRDALSVDSDAAKLAEMGYSQEMHRGFSKWTLLGGTFLTLTLLLLPHQDYDC